MNVFLSERVLLLWSTVVLTIIWSTPCQCHNVETLLHDLPSHKDLRLDASKVRGAIQAAEVLQGLWTDYFLEASISSNGSSITPQCVESAVSILAKSLNTSMPEIVPLLDATGKQAAGLLQGNVYLESALDECFEYNYTAYCGGPVNIILVPQLTWSLGICAPKYCTPSDIAVVLNSTDVFRVNESMFFCTNSKLPGYSAGAVVMIAVSSLLVLLVLVGTAVDKALQLSKTWSNEKTETLQYYSPPIGSSAMNEKTPLVRMAAARARCLKSEVKLHEFVTAFSLYKTVPTLLATKQAPGVITSLNGLRVMSMFWVILGHTFVLNNAGIDNTVTLFEKLSHFTFQAINNAVDSVDSFFFLSGVLVAYLTLRQIKKRGRFPVIHYYVHRYLRLTPSYAYILFFAWFLADNIAPGPILSLGNPFFEACQKYWWSNLLYINNLYPWKLDDSCVGWGWYLANDMQFYIVAPLIFVPFYYFFPVGLVTAGALLLSAFTVTATLSGVYNFQGSEFADMAYGFQTGNITQEYRNFIYAKPWARAPPYLVGLLLGCALYRKARIPFHRVKGALSYLAVWVASGVILFACVYGLYFTWHGHVPSRAENIIYITFSRCAWGVGLALMVFACHNGYGGLINTFLSMKVWTPLSRVTFNAYLVHPIVVIIVYGQLQKTIHYTHITLTIFFIGFVVLSYTIAGMVCLCVEFPLGTIEMLLFKLVGLGVRESQRQVTGTTNEAVKEKKVLATD